MLNYGPSASQLVLFTCRKLTHGDQELRNLSSATCLLKAQVSLDSILCCCAKAQTVLLMHMSPTRREKCEGL